MTLRDVTVNAGNPGLIGSQNLTGIPFIADVRQNFASYSGVWTFDNVATENVTGSFLSTDNSTGNACSSALPAGFDDIDFKNIRYADGAANTAVMQDYTGCGLNGIKIQNSTTANGGGGVAIRLSNGGTIRSATISGPSGYSLACVDVNGNPTPGCLISQTSGIDAYVPTLSVYNGYRSDESLANDSSGIRSSPSAFAATPSGSKFRSVMLDPTYGLMLATTTGNYGFTTALAPGPEGDADLYFANLMPPTSTTGTPTTGGTLSNGSYWYAIRAALTTNCSSATQSAPVLIGPVVLTGGNNAVSISLTQPVGLSTTGDYCYQRFTSAPSNSTLQATAGSQISSGSSATTFVDTGATGSGNTSTAILSNQMTATVRFSPSEFLPLTTNVYALGHDRMC